MKVWAGASAVGLTVAYLAVGCSSSPPNDDNKYMGGGASTAGTPSGGGTPGTAGTPGGGGTPGTAGTPGGGGTPAGGTPAGGTPAGGGSAGADMGGGGTGGSVMEVMCPANVQGHCSEATYPTYDGFTLQLVEDFPKPLDLNTDPVWTWSDGSPADGQTSFREEQVKFADGHMTITAEQPAGCAPKTTNAGCIPPRQTVYGEALSPNKSASIGAMGVWSGELRTKYNNYRYGRYEVKYSAPIANPGQEATDNMSGNYLSTFFIFRTPKNIQWNEIDVELEPWHHDEMAGNIVNATNAAGYPAGNASPFSIKAATKGIANYAITQEHVYSFIWTPTKVSWLCDNQVITEFSGTGNVPIPTLSAKIMANLWVFSGNTFGDGVNNKFPFHATYDYIRFYKWNQETTYPCAAPPGCLPAEDKTQSAQNNPKEVNYGM